MMKNLFKGISLILLGIIWMLFAMLNPWVPILDSLLCELAPFIGLISGIVGVVIIFKADEE